MNSELDNLLIERSGWRKIAHEKLAEIVGPMDNPVRIKTLAFAALLASEAVKTLSDEAGDFQAISKLPSITMAWILAMEEEGHTISILIHRPEELLVDDSIYLSIKTSDGKDGVLPINPFL